ncbi:MAG: EAL domain-containing protein [Pseudomonadota bacterium]
MNSADSSLLLADRLRRVESRQDRERRARIEAERLLESKSLELYEANLALSALAADLERRVEERTRELSVERQRALQLAEVDALTGIANRASFAHRLTDLLADPQASAQGIAVLLIDLDDFKTVNDTLGHAAGDTLLIEVARRLVDTVRPGDVVARLGGDEFAVIACAVGSARQGAVVMAHRLLRALCRPATIDARLVPCSCSIGLAEAGGPGRNADELLRDADLALYASKRGGRERVTSFEVALRAELEQRAALEAEVRHAVVDKQIEPWYQPIMHRSSGRFVGVEVLARWHRPDGKVRAPADFLDAVEVLGLLDTMMENMLQRALREAGPLIADGSLEYLSINVSPSQFNQGWALNRLPALLAETGFPASALVVEITETALLQDIDRTRTMLSALTDRGMRIALDDFGVGYSNFSLLRQLPFDLLKLDRSLICDIETDKDALALAECILNLAVRLRIKVVAEGVETQQQAALLAAGGCATMQGYWFARPQRDLSTWFAPDADPPPRAWA